MRQRQPRIYRPDHLAFIRTLPCIVSGDDVSVEAAHIRYADPRVDKRPCGNSEKPDDMWTLPLADDVHKRQHRMNEREFWRQVGIDPVFYALALWSITGDHERGCRIVQAAHEHARNLLMAG